MTAPAWLPRPARSGRALAGAFCAALALEGAVVAGAAGLLGTNPPPATREAPLKVSLVELAPTPPPSVVEPPPPEPPPPEPPPPVPEQAPEPPPPPEQAPPNEPAPLPPPPEPPPPPKPRPPPSPVPKPRRKTPPLPIDKPHLQPPDTPQPVAPPAPASASLNELALFQGRVRQAVQRAVVYPMAAREMHQRGRVEVGFTLRDGLVGDIGLAQSSGSPLLDRAAMAAVRGASYPAAPSSARGQTKRFLIWVEFRPADE